MTDKTIDWASLSDQEIERLWLYGETKTIQDAAHTERVRRNQTRQREEQGEN